VKGDIVTENSITVDKLQKEVLKLKKIINDLEAKKADLEVENTKLNAENIQLKKKATLHQGGVIVPRKRV